MTHKKIVIQSRLHYQFTFILQEFTISGNSRIHNFSNWHNQQLDNLLLNLWLFSNKLFIYGNLLVSSFICHRYPDNVLLLVYFIFVGWYLQLYILFFLFNYFVEMYMLLSLVLTSPILKAVLYLKLSIKELPFIPLINTVFFFCLIALVGTVSANGPGSSHTKDLKTVLIIFLLNTHHYKIRIKGKVK